MQGVIGASLVKGLQPATKPYEVRDTKLTGFLIRVQPSGSMSYYVEIGRGRRLSIGKADAVLPAQAREKAKEILAKVELGEDVTASPKANTLNDFLNAMYEPWALAHLRTGAATVKRFRTNFADLLPLKLSDITPLTAEKWRTARLGKVKPATVNRDLTDLKSMLAKAVEWKVVKTHPLERAVKKTKLDENGLARYLTDHEERRLRAALIARETRMRSTRAGSQVSGDRYVDHLEPMTLISLNTGLRQGELFALEWAHVDLPGGNLTVVGTNAKSKQTRHVPLNAEAMAVLTKWRLTSQGNGLVFPSEGGSRFIDVKTAWAALLKSAKIEQFRWHDLRHSFASKLVMAGVDLNTVRELLGHADLKMTLRYAHLAPAAKASAVAKLIPVM